MEQKLRFVHQNILHLIAVHTKFPTTKQLLCKKNSLFILTTIPKIVHIDLDTILTEGRGLQWFTTDGLNSIVLNFQVANAPLLRTVKVQFSRQEADVVDVKPLDGGILEIFYRADGADALGLTIIVSDQIVCQTTAQLGMSVETAMAELEGMKRKTVDSSKYFSILLCWPENAFVVAAFPLILEFNPEYKLIILNSTILIAYTLIMSYLLISEIPLFALKFKNFSFHLFI
jgi:hypothetical protein